LKKIIALILLVNLVYYSYSQNLNSEIKVIELRGKILDASTGTPVRFAHIINTRKSFATISDTSGYFRVIMLKSDTLKISSIGYELYFYLFSDTVENKNQFVTIYLNPKVYELNTINIYEERWNAFVYNFSTTDIKVDATQQRLEVWFENLVPADELMMLATAARGFGFPINYKTSRDRQIAKVEELERQSELNKLANEKFNEELVGKITELEGDELKQFMKYCVFDRDFVLKKNEYDLIIIVQDIFEIYNEEKLNEQD